VLTIAYHYMQHLLRFKPAQAHFKSTRPNRCVGLVMAAESKLSRMVGAFRYRHDACCQACQAMKCPIVMLQRCRFA
jgi:hypothetical protein